MASRDLEPIPTLHSRRPDRAGRPPSGPIAGSVRRRCRYRPCGSGGGAVETGAATRVAATRGDLACVDADRRHADHGGRRQRRCSGRLLGRQVPGLNGRVRHRVRLQQLPGGRGARAALGGLPRNAGPRPRDLDRDRAAGDVGPDLTHLRPGRGCLLQRARGAAVRAGRGSRQRSLRRGRDHARVRPPHRGESLERAVARARLGPEALGVGDAGLREGAQAAFSFRAPRIPCSTRRTRAKAGPRRTACSTSARPAAPETPWQIVDQALYPTAAALIAAEQDVTTPWTAGTTTTQTAVLTRTKKTRTFTVATQLDGTLQDDSEAFGGDARLPRRVRILDPRCTCGFRAGRLAHLHGLRSPELPVPGH